MVAETEDQGQAEGLEGPLARGQRELEIEGVFVVREGIAHFTPVEVGITGQEYFEVISGVQPGDTVVAGPYQRIRDLIDGDAVKEMEGSSTSSDGPGGGEG